MCENEHCGICLIGMKTYDMIINIVRPSSFVNNQTKHMEKYHSQGKSREIWDDNIDIEVTIGHHIHTFLSQTNGESKCLCVLSKMPASQSRRLTILYWEWL